MIKTYKYRIYPTRKQTRLLNSQIEICRIVYNYCLNEKKELWDKDKKQISMYDQFNKLPLLKKEFPEFKNVYSQVLQNVCERVNLAYNTFFKRIKSGEKKVGYPRFKSYNRYSSMTFPQYGGGIKIIKDRIRLNGIGCVKAVFHRQIEGKIKTATIKCSSTNKWYVSFSCELEDLQPLPKSELNVGIDVGLETFAYLSDDTKIENQRFFKTEEINLAKAQQKLDKITKKDKNGKVLNGKDLIRLKTKKVVSRIHERIKFKRDNFTHQESRKIINKYQVIVVEDLNVKQMKSRDNKKSFKAIRKSISDVAWGSFFSLLNVKAEEAGRTVIKVNPAYTSQDCSGCGYRKKKLLNTRIHDCKKCGLVINRDLNASINILRIGLDSLGVNP